MKRQHVIAALCFIATGIAACAKDRDEPGIAGSNDELGATRDGGSGPAKDNATSDAAKAPPLSLDGLCEVDDGDLSARALEIDTSLDCASNGTDSASPFFTSDLGELPGDYTDLHALCARMNPTAETRDDLTDPRLARDLRTYLRSLVGRPALARALAALPDDEARVDALARTWFTRNAFEHVLCGELNPNGTVGGLHQWSELYLAEREGRADYRCRRAEVDPVVSTIRFDWKPPGRASYARKPTGSFPLGMSPACFLAVGYVAASARTASGNAAEGSTFRATLYGATREWTLAMDSGGMLSLYPLAGAR